MNDRFKFRIPMFTDKGTFIEFQYLELGDFIECTLCGTNAEPQQCTGLKDKNDKLIYEGDIVKMHGWWYASGPAGYERDICVVEFDDGVCGFTPMCNYDCDCCVYHDAEECEVIGNIYENKELLEVNNDR